MTHRLNLAKLNLSDYLLNTDKVMLSAMVLAICVHVGLIFGVNFNTKKPSDAMMQDVSLVINTLSKEIDPKQADYLAQISQQGGGDAAQAQKITNTDISQYNLDMMEYVNPNETMRARQIAMQEAPDHYVIMTTYSFEKDSKDKKQKNKKAKQAENDKNSTAAMIATLEADYAKSRQELAKSTGIKTVNSITAKADPSAAYVDYFRKTVERVGNRYYPSAAKAQGLSGDVRLMVVLKPNGSIKGITLLKSSGHELLDEAAKQSVRYGAPYKKFPLALNSTNELRIIRTWRFIAGADAPIVTDQ